MWHDTTIFITKEITVNNTTAIVHIDKETLPLTGISKY